MTKKSLSKTICFLIILVLMFSFPFQAKAITWSINITRLTNYTFVDGYPCIAQTQDRRIWVLWSKEVMGKLALFYKVSSNLGRTWQDEQNLTQLLAPGNAQNPSMIQAKDGTIWVTWTSDVPPPQPPNFNITAVPQNLTIQQGNTQNSTIVVNSINEFDEMISLYVIDKPDGVTTSFDPPSVEPPPNGQVNSTLTISVNSTATLGNYSLTVVGKSTSQTHSVGINLEITTSGTQAARIAVDLVDTSETVPTQFEDYEIYYRTSHDNGETWSQEFPLTNNSADDMHPSIIQLQNGTMMIFWQSNISGNHDIWYKTTTDGVLWSNATQLTTDAYGDQAPTATQAKDDQIWVTWSSNRIGNNEIFYKIYNGSSWSNDYLLSSASSLDSDVQPAIVQAVDGTVMIFWSSDTAGNYNIYSTNSTDNGANWSTRFEFDATSYEDMWPAVMRAADTRIWVTWMSNNFDQPDGNYEICIKTSLPGDVNSDNIVDGLDYALVNFSYGAFEGEQNYYPNVDINKDGIVDAADFWIVAYYIPED